MDQEYKILNKYLNDFFLYYNYPLYTDYLSEYLKLSIFANEMIGHAMRMGILNFQRPFPEHTLSLSSSLELCDEFIKTYLSPYYDRWKEYLADGVIDFSDKEQILLDGETPRGSWSRTRRENSQFFREIDVELKHNYQDPPAIIHEFVHQLNILKPPVDAEGEETVSRSLFTEAVSIYFETLMYRFMEEKGYSKEEVAKAQVSRIQIFSRAVIDSIDGLILLRDYQLFGKVSSDNLKQARALHLISFVNEKKYQEVASRYDKKIASRYDGKIASQKEDDSNETKLQIDFFTPFRYVLGTLLAYWSIEQDDPNMPWKFIEFNEDLAKDRDLEYTLDRFHLNSGEFSSLVTACEKEFIRCSNHLKGQEQKMRSSRKVVT